MSASLIAKLQLDIAGFQAALAKSNGELEAFKQKSVRQVDAIGLAQKRLNQALKDTGAAVPKVNPWSTAALGSEQYLQKLKALAKEQKLMEQHQLHAAAKAGPSAANPWASGAPAYQRQLAERAAEAAAAAQQRAAAQAAVEAAAAQKKQALDQIAQRHASQGIIDGRLQLQLIEARISGNAKEVVQLETRMRLLNQMRQIQQQTGVSQREAYSLSQRLGPGGAVGGGARGNFALGMAAMQAQDIAVQLQMGTSAAIVLGQQGSQLLSAFGTGGALAGGAIAIGAAFLTMGQNARKSFDEAKSEAAKLDAELAQISSGTLPEMAGGISKIDEAIKHWTDELSNLNSTFGTAANIADIFGGPDVEERIALASQMLNKLGSDRVNMQNSMLELSEKELQMQLALANGEEDKAETIKREIEWAREWKRIDVLNLPRNAKDKLKANAWNAEGAKAQAEQNKKDEAAAKKIETAEKRLAETRKKADEDQLDLSEKIERKKEEIAAPSKADPNDRAAVLEEETKRIEAQMELNKLMEDQARLAHEAAEDSKRNADVEKQRLETKKREMAEIQKQAAARVVNRENVMLDLEILRLKAAGRTKDASKLERDKRIAEEAAKERRETGASAEQALKNAQERARLQDKIERRESGLPSHIYGVTGEGKRMGSPGGGGLDGFKRMQEKKEIVPGVWGYKYHDGGLSNRGERSIPGRYMGGEQGSLADRARRAVGSQDAAEKSGSSGIDLASKMLALLTRLTATLAG